MSSVNVHYFALLKEKAGKEVEAIGVEAMDYRSLYEQLALKYDFKLTSDMIQVAVNDEFASMSDQVVPGSKVVFIPPVAGG